MNRILVAAVALATVAGFAATAEAKQDSQERAAWSETVRNVSAPSATAAPVVEGRNAATTSDSSEAYIRRAVDAGARSN